LLHDFARMLSCTPMFMSSVIWAVCCSDLDTAATVYAFFMLLLQIYSANFLTAIVQFRL
jgi:hypothetical protein